MMRELRMGLRILKQAVRALAWMFVTLWLGGQVLVRWGRILDRSHLLLAQTVRCPRGHRVPLYGVYRCSTCRATMEGHVFRPCPSCGSVPTFTPCPRCRIAVRNPLQ
jgi:hypothetical protein